MWCAVCARKRTQPLLILSQANGCTGAAGRRPSQGAQNHARSRACELGHCSSRRQEGMVPWNEGQMGGKAGAPRAPAPAGPGGSTKGRSSTVRSWGSLYTLGPTSTHTLQA